MCREARSLSTIALVLTIVMLATSQSSEAQFFRRSREDNSAATVNRQSNTKAESKKVQDPRSAQVRTNSSAPSPGRSPVDPRQQNPIPNGNQNRFQPGQPVRSTNPNTAQTQRSQPTPAPRPQPARPLNTSAQSQAAAQKSPPQPRPPQAAVNANNSRSSRFDPRASASSNLGKPAASTGSFQSSPLNQPRLVAEPARRMLGDPEESSRDPARAKSEPAQLSESSKPVNEQEVLNRFGLVLSEVDESVTVFETETRGHAAQAGLKRGDKIVSIGGAPIASQREFAEIAGLLSEGDQIELVIIRDGREEKAFIQYGNTVESAPEPTGNESDMRLSDSNWSATAQSETERLQQLVAQQRQVIAELQKRVRELESGQGSSSF